MCLNNFCLAIVLLGVAACRQSESPKIESTKDSIAKIDIRNQVPNQPRRVIKPLKIDEAVKSILVKKSENKLIAFFGDTFKVYRVAIGSNPVGHKVQQGDNRTPEGVYSITIKNPNSRGYKSLKISYPNTADRNRAWQAGLDPGGDICIHGLWWSEQDPQTHWQSNWTRGCVALNNQQMDELYKYTSVGTTVKIVP